MLKLLCLSRRALDPKIGEKTATHRADAEKKQRKALDDAQKKQRQAAARDQKKQQQEARNKKKAEDPRAWSLLQHVFVYFSMLSKEV